MKPSKTYVLSGFLPQFIFRDDFLNLLKGQIVSTSESTLFIMSHPTTPSTATKDCPLSSLIWLPCPKTKEAVDQTTQKPVEMEEITLKNGWKIQWTLSLRQGLQHWKNLASNDNLYLSTPYLELLDQLDLQGVTTGMVVFTGPNQDRFGMLVQQFSFSAKDQIGQLAQGTPTNLWERSKTGMKKSFGKLIETNILTIGQMHLTGPHGLRTADQNTIREEWLPTIIDGLDAVAAKWPVKIHGIMLKDMDLHNKPADYGFHTLPVQPNMVLHIDPTWQQFDDYTAAMSSKYRTRARRARKKSKGIERREFSLEEIQQHETVLHNFYLDIANTSDYNVVYLPENYFTKWKEHFGNEFHLWGYYHNEELIGFSTAIKNSAQEMEAHFLGFRQEFNRSHQLYLNILYDLVEEGLAAKAKHLVFARTALEIKSSVGAVPEEMLCWFRTRIKIVNPLVPFFAPLLSPLPEWTQRRPFKGGEE